jgi:hypothetical protein
MPCRIAEALLAISVRPSFCRMPLTVRGNHVLLAQFCALHRTWSNNRRTLISGSLFMTFLIRASGSAGCRASSDSVSAVAICRFQNACRNALSSSPACTKGRGVVGVEDEAGVEVMKPQTVADGMRGRTEVHEAKICSDTGNRTPGYRVRGDNVSHYTISDMRGDIKIQI